MDPIKLLLYLLDQAYDKRSWHGPNLRGSIRGLDHEHAAWRPKPGRHCIADIALHAAYWKYTVRRRLRGDRRGSFPVKGSNWFPLPEPFTAEKWKEYVKLLEDEHRQLRLAVSAMSANELLRAPSQSKVSNLALITGIANHDVYHAGQIQSLKRLQG
jgi:hypothetical protein